VNPDVSRVLGAVISKLGFGLEMRDQIVAELGSAESVDELPRWMRDLA
jgi:hypothetical protein